MKNKLTLFAVSIVLGVLVQTVSAQESNSMAPTSTPTNAPTITQTSPNSPSNAEPSSSRNKLDLSLSPATAYLHIKPGDTLHHVIILENHGQVTYEISTMISEFSSDDRTGLPIIKDSSALYQLQWSGDSPLSSLASAATNPVASPTSAQDTTKISGVTQILNQQFKLDKPLLIQPGEKKEFTIDLKLDITEEEKEYPLIFLFIAKPVSTPLSSNSQSSVYAIMASNLLLYVSRSEQNQSLLAIDQLKYPKLIDSFAALSLEILGKNAGKHTSFYTGQVTIANQWGKTVANYLIYPDMVLTGHNRVVRLVDKAGAKLNDQGQLDTSQDQKLLSRLAYKKLFLLGIYTITIELNGQATVIKTFAFPFAILILTTLAVGCYYFYNFWLKKHT